LECCAGEHHRLHNDRWVEGDNMSVIDVSQTIVVDGVVFDGGG
jgi:hypothetical protein